MGAGLATSVSQEHPDFAQPILAIAAHRLQPTEFIEFFYGTHRFSDTILFVLGSNPMLTGRPAL
jgi:hypothetical protein